MSEENQMDNKMENVEMTDSKALDFQSYSLASLFKKDKTFVYCQEKLQKIISALYLITNLFDDKEPIKWEIRTLSSELVSAHIKGRTAREKTDLINKITDTSLEIVSLLEAASYSALVSSMNVSILKKEFFDLLGILKRQYNFDDKSQPLGSAFFKVDDKLYTEISKDIKGQNIKDSYDNNSNNSTGIESSYAGERAEKLKEFGNIAIKKGHRRNLIIQLIKRKREIMIKDAAEVISNCSEKTIQRELQALVKEGLLKKDGERRWTKYSLV